MQQRYDPRNADILVNVNGELVHRDPFVWTDLRLRDRADADAGRGPATRA